MTILSSDTPSFDPKDDLFGHAPFAKILADTIHRYPNNDALVLALYGPWGSGKSTVLNYVQHYLKQYPAAEQPAIIIFNPWWFSGQENLARAFLGQMQAVLPAKNKQFEKLAGLLGDFAEGVGALIDLSGVTSGAGGKLGKLIGMAAKQKPKDVPALKAGINKVLKEAKTKILVIIDDIDRLTPEETRQIFTVIKALADFPNVIYLLAFDREVAVHAIQQQNGLPGERYLEKIIQVPFELPPVDRMALRNALFKCLDRVLGDTPNGLFDRLYWETIFYEGIDTLIKVPRDVIRFANTLSVTYPPVCGEVNPVDFFALEAIRVFLPDLYDILRTNPEQFSGCSRDNRYADDRNTSQDFRQYWVTKIPETLQGTIQAWLARIFPKLGQPRFNANWLPEWRKSLRVCHPEVFPIYFRLTIPLGAISRSEMAAWLALAGEPENFGNVLAHAKVVKLPDGLSKAQLLLERLMDHVNVKEDIPDAHIPSVIHALFNVGDALIDPAEEHRIFFLSIISCAAQPVYHLLKRVEKVQRADILRSGIRSGNAIAVQWHLLRTLASEATNKNNADETTLLTIDEVEQLKTVWLDKVRSLSVEINFLHHAKLSMLLDAWKSLAGKDEVQTWCAQNTASDDGLMSFLAGMLQHVQILTGGHIPDRLKPRLNLSWLEDYLDTTTCAERLRSLIQKGEVTDEAREAVSQYLKEFEMLQAGINPDD